VTHIVASGQGGVSFEFATAPPSNDAFGKLVNDPITPQTLEAVVKP